MTTLIPNKKIGHLTHRNGDVVGCAESLGGENIFSDCDIIRQNKRKSGKFGKDYSTKQKHIQNSLSGRHTARRTEHSRRIKSVSSSRIVMSPQLFTNQTNEKYSDPANAKIQMKNTTKYIVAKRKNASHKTNDDKIEESKISDFDYGSYYSENTLNPLRTHHSLIDLRDYGNNDAISPRTSFRHNTCSVAPSETLNFKKGNSSHRKKHSDYLKEFDLIRYGGMSREIAKLSKNERIFTLVPNISPSEPITLPKRKYSRGTISIRDSDEVSRRNVGNCEEDLNNMTLDIEFGKTDVGVTSEKLEAEGCHRDSKCSDDTQLLNNGDDVLFSKKPVRIKCTEEVSNKMKDLIIYSEDFVKELLKEKGNSTSKKELYESILKETSDYKGKNLKIIIDDDFCTLHDKRKPRANIKSTTADKPPKKIQMKTSKPVVQIKKKSSNTPRCSKNSSETSVKSSKETLAEQNVPLKEDNSNERVDTRLFAISKSMQFLQRETEKFESLNKGKLRTALKNINIENIIVSSFSYYFHFFAKLEHPLKSGATISKKNSTKWLKESGIVCDNAGRNMAEKCFKAIANAKCVLNMCDYVKCLNEIARNRNMLLVDMICRMMSIDLHSVAKSHEKKMEKQRNKLAEQRSTPEDEQKTESEEDASCLEII